MVRRTLVALLTVVALLGLSVAPTFAIINGRPDLSAHPFVGLAADADSFCSGSLLSPTVFLTAAHCFANGQSVAVAIDPSGVWASPTQVAGTVHNHPQFCLPCGAGLPKTDAHDVAVIVLQRPIALGTYGQLPSAGRVNNLPVGTNVTLVGYGTQAFTKQGKGGPQQFNDFQRTVAPTQLVSNTNVLSAAFLTLAANPGDGRGGACFGDSGGPDLLGSSRTILAINSLAANVARCSGVTWAYRIDTPDALSFIRPFVS